MKPRTLFAGVVSALLCATCFGADPPSERDKIEAALARMDKSDLVFIRNGSEYTGKAAADHMRAKLKQAGDSVKTFDEFVDKVASKSSMSGKPYLVKFKDGSTTELAKWLREKPAA
jgi:hypothetical protein